MKSTEREFSPEFENYNDFGETIERKWLQATGSDKISSKIAYVCGSDSYSNKASLLLAKNVEGIDFDNYEETTSGWNGGNIDELIKELKKVKGEALIKNVKYIKFRGTHSFSQEKAIELMHELNKYNKIEKIAFPDNLFPQPYVGVKQFIADNPLQQTILAPVNPDPSSQARAPQIQGTAIPNSQTPIVTQVSQPTKFKPKAETANQNTNNWNISDKTENVEVRYSAVSPSNSPKNPQTKIATTYLATPPKASSFQSAVSKGARGNKIRICNSDIYKTRGNIDEVKIKSALEDVITIALKKKDIGDEEFKLMREFLVKNGGFSNKFEPTSGEGKNVTGNDKELDDFIRDNQSSLGNDVEAIKKKWKSFSAQVQRMNGEIGIYSGREENLKTSSEFSKHKKAEGCRLVFALGIIDQNLESLIKKDHIQATDNHNKIKLNISQTLSSQGSSR